MAYRISFTRNTKVSTKKVLDFEIQDAVRSLKRGESAHLEYVELSKIIEIMRWYTKGYVFKIDGIGLDYYRYGDVSADLVITRKKRFARSLKAPKKLFKHFER